ncbi:hypothetical protein D9753_34715 [Streptomyces dangxiongensis]|uniref:Uncharacterized protein n=1 Tax=Streptomyces dangxiongensis TaxID=1442032 RepID=A0A3G2JL64_9ACTN|nr:hypothetical protein D9753_34715 [Streptomyces dangxiongensis]
MEAVDRKGRHRFRSRPDARGDGRAQSDQRPRAVSSPLLTGPPCGERAVQSLTRAAAAHTPGPKPHNRPGRRKLRPGGPDQSATGSSGVQMPHRR